MKTTTSQRCGTLLLAMALLVTVAGAYGAPVTANEAVVDFDKHGEKLGKTATIAYLTQCVDNPYCQANLAGVKDAAAKFNYDIKIFDAQFNPNGQLKQVQNAVAGNFAGYLFAPTAAAQACSMYRSYLKPTGKPVVVYDMPMCGDSSATAGTAGTVLMQTQAYYDQVVEVGFASCKGTCQAAAVGGYVGTDLFNYWERALAAAQKMYPNVHLIVNQPGNFDPQTAQRVIQDSLSAHPDITLILSQWDEMSRGVIQAVKNAGKTPGKDVMIYSVGATKDGVARVASGEIAATGITLPYEEGYYAGVAMVMALQGKPLNAFVDESRLPMVVGGPGTVILTRENIARFKPRY